MSFLNSRTNLGPAARAAASRPQAAGEDHPSPDGAKREAAPHAPDVLQRQPEAGRPNEGTAGGDDRPQSAGDSGLVPEQAVQRQEEEPADEAAAAAADQRQDGKRTEEAPELDLKTYTHLSQNIRQQPRAAGLCAN